MSEKNKIAVLGGGCAAMAAVWELTKDPDWQEKRSLDVYQLGWRLGGKGASGRNSAYNQRIEEHGLHVWMGFYENAFRLIKEAYKELDRPIDQPLARFEDAFQKQSNIVNVEPLVRGEESHWTYVYLKFPENNLEPGTAKPEDKLLSLTSIVRTLLGWFWEWVSGQKPIQVETEAMVSEWLQEPTDTTSRKPLWNTTAPSSFHELCLACGKEESSNFSEEVQQIVKTLLEQWTELEQRDVEPTEEELASFLQQAEPLFSFFQELLENNSAFDDSNNLSDLFRVLLEAVAFGLACLRGILADWIIIRGWDYIDNQEWTDWLVKHGLPKAFTNSFPLRAMYDMMFAYKGGDRNEPRVAAGAMMRLLMRMWFSYRGALFYKMMAGMGDTIFTPLYEVLKKRGVNFHFFHKVKELRPNKNKRSVDFIVMEKQVYLKAPEQGYNPLVDVKGLPSWPSEPDWNQIKDGQRIKKELEEKKTDLESAWCDYHVEEFFLESENDFDQIVLGIPPDALRTIAKPLMEVKPQFSDMVLGTPTIETGAVQLWTTPTLRSFGWTQASSILTGEESPFDTYADMTHLLPREGWGGATVPQMNAYFCGVLPRSPDTAPLENKEYPQQRVDEVRELAVRSYETQCTRYWPKGKNGERGTMEWKYLYDESPHTMGEARMDSQYWRANVSPSERYTQTFPGFHKTRLASNDSGFSNLVLAGDWTRNGLNMGCVESAVMSGMQASRALCGFPEFIAGEIVYPSSGIQPESGTGYPVEDPTGIPHRKERPYFVDKVAMQQVPQPYALDDTRLYSFFLEASEKGKLQDYIDTTLNDPRRNRKHQKLRPYYKVLFDNVLTFMADIRKTYSTYPGLNAGWLKEVDAGFWVVVGEYEREKKPNRIYGLPKQILLYPVGLFVDNAFALVGGREIYGYPKAYGDEIVYPKNPKDAGPFYVTTLLKRLYNIEEPFEVGEAWRLDAVKEHTAIHSIDKFIRSAHPDLKESYNREIHGWDESSFTPSEDSLQLLQRFYQELLVKQTDTFGIQPVDDVNFQSETDWFSLNLGMVFLKQFRDVVHPLEACYQSVIEAPLQMKTLKNFGFMSNRFHLQSEKAESLQFHDVLGLQPRMTVRVGTWIEGDLIQKAGKRIWRSTNIPIVPVV
jgi:uncharacterized protein with NAD-binding domain and iron-sulfur cluster